MPKYPPELIKLIIHFVIEAYFIKFAAVAIFISNNR